MTHEEYKIESAIIEAHLQALALQKKELNKAYLATSPLKIGDKVLVKLNNGIEVFAFVGDVKAPASFQKGPFGYELLKCKKDGTESLNSAGIYTYQSIEKVENSEKL